MRIPRVVIGLLIFSVIACSDATYDMRQIIEMGPFAFEITKASEKIEIFTGGGRHKRIYVYMKLHTDKSTPTNVDFGDFLNGRAKGNRMIESPTMKIVDNKGKKFDSIVNRVSGKTRWRAEFILIDHRRGIPSGLDYLDRHVSDFQLVIKNPDPKKGQPRRVTIKLQ
jgi:hypothetical protein